MGQGVRNRGVVRDLNRPVGGVTPLPVSGTVGVTPLLVLRTVGGGHIIASTENSTEWGGVMPLPVLGGRILFGEPHQAQQVAWGD